jgi:iron complex transport system substrate-binding protein
MQNSRPNANPLGSPQELWYNPPMRSLFFIIFWLLFVGSAAATPPQSKVVSDAVGRKVTLPDTPRRVVALAPSITEIVFTLERQDRLVGVSQHSDYPPEAAALPQVGSYVNLNVERIAALQPDLCLAIKDGNPLAVVEQLESFGIPVYAVDPVDLQTVIQSVIAIGDVLNAQPRAKSVVARMEERLRQVSARISTAERRPKVFFQIGVSPIVSVGSATFIDKLITLAGGINVAAGPTPYPRFSREQVIGLAPEVMIVSSMDRAAVFEQVLDEWRQWPSIPAVRDKALFIAPTNLFDRPTPRLVEGLELLARLIHPELFEATP